MKKIYQAPVTSVMSAVAETMMAVSIRSVSGADGMNVGAEGTSSLDKGIEANSKADEWSDIWE